MNTHQGRGNILYVDDEEGNLLAFMASFRKYYDNIYTVKSAQEGIEVLRHHPVDVVLTDQRMPGITGVEFLEMIIPEFPDTIRMIVTGYSDIHDVINAINTGRIFRYIQKPWDVNELKLSIDQAIKTRSLELANRELVDVLQKEVSNKEQILKIFQKYVPVNVINEVISEEQFASKSAEVRVVTVLYSDIKGFNLLSSKIKPVERVEFLNDYFTIMAKCIEKYKGFINKFSGTSISVVFGAPISYMGSSSNAVYCALEMIASLDKINETYQNKYGHTIEIDIGIHTGEAITGSMGTAKSMGYTIIGYTVDIAAQVQELFKEIPKNGVYITQTTYDEVKERFHCESVGEKTIKNKEEPINIYKIVKPLD